MNCTCAISSLSIKRYRKNNANLTEKEVCFFNSSSRETKIDYTIFNMTINISASPGYASFVIKDIMNQGYNQDNSTVNVTNSVYVFRIEITLSQEQRIWTTNKSIELHVIGKHAETMSNKLY
jgi:hypothetical protein